MTALPVTEAASELGVKPGTLRRWVAEGCPIVQRGRRGRGCALLIDPDAVRRWRGADQRDALILEIAQALPEVLAGAADGLFKLIEGDPAKRRMAGLLAAGWEVGASAVLDRLREHCPSVPGLADQHPDAIQRLQKIAKSL